MRYLQYDRNFTVAGPASIKPHHLSQRRHGQPSLCRIKVSTLRVVHLMPKLLTQALCLPENRGRVHIGIGRSVDFEGVPVTHSHPTHHGVRQKPAVDSAAFTKRIPSQRDKRLLLKVEGVQQGED